MRSKQMLQEASNEVDLTPMLDVVFILLIFFIVTASFLKEKSMPSTLVPESQSNNTESFTAVFNVDSNNNIVYENRVVNQNAVRSLVAQKYAENPKGFAVVVNAHDNSSVETYVGILDAARQAKVNAVSLKSYN